MKNKKLIFLIAILILILALNIYLSFRFLSIVGVREFDAQIFVSDKIGIDLNKSALTFGAVAPGGSSIREITFENTYGFPVKVKVYGEGKIGNFISSFEKTVEVGKLETIKIVAHVPEDSDLGEYEGKVIIKIRKVYK